MARPGIRFGKQKNTSHHRTGKREGLEEKKGNRNQASKSTSSRMKRKEQSKGELAGGHLTYIFRSVIGFPLSKRGYAGRMKREEKERTA